MSKEDPDYKNLANNNWSIQGYADDLISLSLLYRLSLLLFMIECNISYE